MSRKEKREYRKTVKKYQKQLMKFAKKWQPYDYGFMLEALSIMINGMKEYYSKGNCVMAGEYCEVFSEMKDHPTREQICNELLTTLEVYDDMLENQYLDRFFDLLKKYIGELWD